jgi:hypothetical protein
MPRACFALALALSAACAAHDNQAPDAQRACPGVEVLLAASDYASSKVCGWPGTCTSGTDLGGDPMLTAGGGQAFFLARDNDLVFELDPACGTPKNRVSLSSFATRDATTGTRRAANPHDAAAAPDGTVLVTLYGTAKLAFVKDGVLEPKALDLSSFDEDGNPQADAVSIVSVAGVPKAFVTLERLDDGDFLRSKKPSQILRVDVASRAIDATFDLAGRNPFNPMSELDGFLFMAEPGNFDSKNDELAGIERFDTTTSSSLLLVREITLGGSVAEIAVTKGCGAAIVAGPERDINPTWLVTFDPITGEVFQSREAPLLGPTSGYDLQALVWRGDSLYVGDRRRSAEGYPIHVFQRTGLCTLARLDRNLFVPQRPVALRAAIGNEKP